MTPAQAKLIELDNKKELIKAYHEEMQETLLQVAKEVGVNGMFQGPDGVVYQVINPKGRYVHYEKLSVIRTKRPNEKTATLSKKAAEAHGFSL